MESVIRITEVYFISMTSSKFPPTSCGVLSKDHDATVLAGCAINYAENTLWIPKIDCRTGTIFTQSY